MVKFIIISGRREFCDFISSRADSLQKMDSLNKLGGGEFITYHVTSHNNDTDLLIDFIYSKVEYEHDDNVAIFSDEIAFNKLSKINTSFLLCHLDSVNSIKEKQFHNYISSAANKAVKKLNLIKSIVDDGGIGEMARLPIKNFDVVKFKEFVREASMRYNSTVSDNDFQKLASDLKMMRKPKKRSDSKNKYYIDDKNRHFSLGDEDHSLHDTKDHETLCDISAKYRFGCKIDSRKHFNVSAGDKDSSKLSTEFYHCHGDDVIKIRNKSHVNMFSNDFIS